MIDLPATKQDEENAIQIALGLGILKQDIIIIEDQTPPEINKILMVVKRRFRILAEKGLRSFLFAYATGHGAAD